MDSRNELYHVRKKRSLHNYDKPCQVFKVKQNTYKMIKIHHLEHLKNDHWTSAPLIHRLVSDFFLRLDFLW